MAARKSSRQKTARASRPAPTGSVSLATLGKRAKAGDRDALAELVARSGDADQKVVIAATTAIANAGTREAHEALAALALESKNSGCRFIAMKGLDRACKTHPTAIELVIKLCEDPRVDEDDYPLALLSNLVGKDAALGRDPRVLRSLRRALGASHPYAQEAAVGALGRLGDTASLPRIVALLDQEERGPDLLLLVAEAIVELGGGAEELARLRAAKARVTDDESSIEHAIEKLARRVEGRSRP